MGGIAETTHGDGTKDFEVVDGVQDHPEMSGELDQAESEGTSNDCKRTDDREKEDLAQRSTENNSSEADVAAGSQAPGFGGESGQPQIQMAASNDNDGEVTSDTEKGEPAKKSHNRDDDGEDDGGSSSEDNDDAILSRQRRREGSVSSSTNTLAYRTRLSPLDLTEPKHMFHGSFTTLKQANEMAVTTFFRLAPPDNRRLEDNHHWNYTLRPEWEKEFAATDMEDGLLCFSFGPPLEACYKWPFFRLTIEVYETELQGPIDVGGMVVGNEDEVNCRLVTKAKTAFAGRRNVARSADAAHGGGAVSWSPVPVDEDDEDDDDDNVSEEE
ncbi:hypothetical protein B0H63DRAFT_68703 [Podospora didyma]|uniref:Uncharacterized protein n=1 Tax=Podospora didyma TaxID=330526 RepID=A0AAE0N2R7_9PEZI|nr:hypothetical protein B0H63DRAFT_68703 [Podospora didyma]